MKEGTPLSNHLNEFHKIFSQLIAEDIKFLDSMKAIFFSITLLDIWNTFKMTLSNSVLAQGLTSANVEGSLLIEEVNCKNNDKGQGNNALVVKGRSNNMENKGKRGQSRSKSHDPKAKSDIECYYCGKKGHMKKDCNKWKAKKGKGKVNKLEEKKNSSVNIEEINVTKNVSQDNDACKIVSSKIYFTIVTWIPYS